MGVPQTCAVFTKKSLILFIRYHKIGERYQETFKTTKISRDKLRMPSQNNKTTKEQQVNLILLRNLKAEWAI